MLVFYSILFFLYTIFSFSQTDSNLIYFQNQIFIFFQENLWKLGNQYRSIGALIYFLLIVLLFFIYIKIINQIKANKISLKKVNYALIISIIFLVFSNPALSHDIFNYIFNAKMVLTYQVNPHTQTALEFSQDPWTMYMRNTHTSAPYGYGWTLLSLIPAFLSFNKLKLNIFLFKVFIGGFFGLLLYMQSKTQKILDTKNKKYLLYAFALNPLVLIETFSNGHNDVVMMALLMTAVYLFYSLKTKKKYLLMIIPLLAFLMSISIKFASITLIGGVSLWWLSKKKISFGGSNVLASSSPLLITRSQQFLPWYLMWPFSFLPIVKEKFIQIILLAFSFSSMMRYIPGLYLPIHEKPISNTQFRLLEIIITFSIPVIIMLLLMLRKKNLLKK